MIELLPKAQFIITDEKGQRKKGRFSLYALDRFCEYAGIDNFITLLEKMGNGMAIKEYAMLLKYALEDYDRADPKAAGITSEAVMDLIDEMGGLGSPGFIELITHVVSRVNGTPEEEPTGEKKSELKSNLSGQPLSVDALPAG